MNQICFATVIQRLYRLINNADDPCRLIESVCKLLSNEEDFVFVWADSTNSSLKNKHICFSKGNRFSDSDCKLIAHHFSGCSNLHKARLNGGIHILNEVDNDRCLNVIRKYFHTDLSAAIVSNTIQYNDLTFGSLNILVNDVIKISEETKNLIKELCNDIANKLNQMLSQIPESEISPSVGDVREDYLKTLLHCMYEDIIVIDKNYNVVDVNNSVLKIFNKKTEEVLGAKCYSVTHGFDNPCNHWTGLSFAGNIQEWKDQTNQTSNSYQ